ncbi:MAG: PAS domain-containing protein [Gammaproteobacteria bacterium]
MRWRALRPQIPGVMPALRVIRARLLDLTDPRRSVRGKVTLAILLSTTGALLAAGAAMLAHDLRVYRESWVADLATQAAILAHSAAPTLAFDDREAAYRALAAFRARPDVRRAALYDQHGKLYASYGSTAVQGPPRSNFGTTAAQRVDGEIVELRQPVVHDGEEFGTLYVSARYDIAGRVRAYLGIFLLVMVASLGVALALSAFLARIITRPLGSMAAVAQHIIESRDYSTRAVKSTQDEVGVLVDAFNAMLSEVELRAQALETSNSALRAEAATRQAAETALQQARSRLDASMAAAEVGSFVWELQTNRLQADRNLAVLLGVDPGQVLQCTAFDLRKRVHADDLAALRAAEAACHRTGMLPPIEFRVLQPDGTVRWLAMRGKVHLAESGGKLFSALLIDITDRKLAEHALANSERLYRAVGESIDFGVWVCDALGRNVYASDSFLKLVGLSQAECSDLGWIQRLHPDDRDATMSEWQDCLASGRSWYREHRVLGVDGAYHPILAQGVPLRGEDGALTGWTGINLDIRRLKETEEKLRDADRRKDEFLATLAHELRNPLSPISHAVEILQRDELEVSKRHWAREVIGRQVKRMSLLLDDLLDVSRITRGKLVLRREVVPLKVVVDQAIETAQPLLDAKGHEFRSSLPASPVLLYVDPLRVSQALSNLMTNAAKYTDFGGRILLEANITTEGVRFRVVDNGIGVPTESLHRLFEMFSQVDSAIDRSEGGLGIGLALVRGLVGLHGGEVSARSPGLGQGTEFHVSLPASALADGTRSADMRIYTARMTGANRHRVLIADDNRDAADALAMVLAEAGYATLVAYSGQEALELGRQAWPSVILLDVGMPGMNGYEVARRLRQESWGACALVIAITGWGQEDDRLRALAAGFDQHMTKPVEFGAIERSIWQFFANSTPTAVSRISTPG